MVREETKYKNLMELAAAFKSGELSKEEWILTLDNDCSSLRYRGPNPYKEDSDEYYNFPDDKCEEGDNLFRGNGDSDLKDACEAAGIPAEWC